ncbi:MAG: CBS domain-containing protein [Gemmatimonadales bacterium]|nr:MAG: CBS domain-containing protein [Gemmatimonadales bacterium]
MRISEILTGKSSILFTIRPDDSVYAAVEKMADRNIGALLVMDEGGLRGIITERDYRDKIVLKGRHSRETRVDEVMTADVYTVRGEESVEACMSIMTDKEIRHLPVVNDEGKVVGIISIRDLVEKVIDNQQFQIMTLRKYIAGQYPG